MMQKWVMLIVATPRKQEYIFFFHFLKSELDYRLWYKYLMKK